MRRVVVTGLGLVTPLGAEVEIAWKNLIAGKSGAGPITHFDASNQKCRIACEVKPAGHEYGFDAGLRVDHKIQRQVDPFIVFGIVAHLVIEPLAQLQQVGAGRTQAQDAAARCQHAQGFGPVDGAEDTGQHRRPHPDRSRRDRPGLGRNRFR